MPDPAFWTDPGGLPYSRVMRWLYLRDGEPLIATRRQWLDQYNEFAQRQAQIAEDEARYQAELNNHEAMMALYEEQGEQMADMLPMYLHNLRLSHWRKEVEKKTERIYDKIDYAEVEEWYFDEMAYYFHVCSSPMPYGLTIPMFLDPSISDTLSVNFYSKTWVEVNARDHAERPGLWVIVEHRAGRGLVPKWVEYGPLFKAIPKTAAPLVWPVGMGANGKISFSDLDEIYTVLVSGQKGSGKSNNLHCMILTWIQRAQPKHLRLFLTDLKGGLEFYNYTGIPHLGGDVDIKMRVKKDGPLEKTRQGQEVATEPGQVAPMLKYVQAEMNRRFDLMKGKAAKISAYNRKFKKNPLSWWVIIVDELATLADSHYRKECYEALSELVRKGRAVGIYAILATQIPEKMVLTRQIAGNMDFRMVGYLSDGASSALSLGDGSWDATRLPPDVRGRMIVRWNKKAVIQTPYVGEMIIARVIKAVKEGRATTAEDTEYAGIANELFTYALENLDGQCPQADLFKHFRNQIPMHKIKSVLKEFEVTTGDTGFEPMITIGDHDYYLLPSIPIPDDRGTFPRILMETDKFEEQKERWLGYVTIRQTTNDKENAQPVTQGNGKIFLTPETDEPIFTYAPEPAKAVEADSDDGAIAEPADTDLTGLPVLADNEEWWSK